MKKEKDGETVVYVYRPWITVNGKRLYASFYGHKAFKIEVKAEK